MIENAATVIKKAWIKLQEKLYAPNGIKYYETMRHFEELAGQRRIRKCH